MSYKVQAATGWKGTHQGYEVVDAEGVRVAFFKWGIERTPGQGWQPTRLRAQLHCDALNACGPRAERARR